MVEIFVSLSESEQKGSSKKLPFRAPWSRRSVAAGAQDGYATRSATSLDSAERPVVSQPTPLPHDAASTRPPIQSTPSASREPETITITSIPSSAFNSSSKTKPDASRKAGDDRSGASSLGAVSAGGAPAGQPSLALSEATLVHNLVHRVSTRLPAHAPVELLDDVVTQASASLHDISKRRFHLVLSSVLTELEALTKPPYYNPETDFVSVDLLRSQLLLLQLIATCSLHYWVASDTPERRSRRPNPPISLAASQNTNLQSFLDPPPIEEGIAQTLLAHCVVFLRQHAQPDEYAPSLSVAERSTIALETQATLRNISKGHKVVEKELPTTRQSVVAQLYRTAGKIVYFLSAGNWTTVVGRVKNRVGVLATNPNPVDEGDTTEIRLLEWACLDRRRLSAVIQELCGTFIHLKRPSQASLSVILRRSIWSWIDSFPSEFASLSNSGRRLEGGAEILFDLIYTLSESSKKKGFAWPVMTMLLVCCPDILMKLVIGEGGRSSGLSKKFQFLEGLKKAFRGDKAAEVAAACYADLCKAAACTDPNHDESALRLLIPDLEVELEAKLFDPLRPFADQEGQLQTPTASEALIAAYRLGSKRVATDLFPRLLTEEAAQDSKLTAAYAALALITEATQPLREVFVQLAMWTSIETISRVGSSRMYGSGAGDEYSSRNELAKAILRIWIADLRFLTQGMESKDGWSNVLLAIVGLLDDANHVSVRKLAASTLLALHESETEAIGEIRDGAFEISALRVSFGVVRHVIQSKVDPVEESKALQLLLNDILRYHALLNTGPTPQTVHLLTQDWTGHWAAIEIALLSSLTSSELDNQALAVLCFQRAAAVLDLMESLGASEQQTEGNVIRVLAAYFKSKPATSPTARLRQALEVLSTIKEPTPGLLAAWGEGIRRWKELSGVIFSRVVDDDSSEHGSDSTRREQIESLKSPEQQFSEWGTLCAFLLAVSGASSSSAEVASLETIIPVHFLPSRFYRRVDRAKNIDRLVQELVDLLVSDSMKVREAVKDALGFDLSEVQFPLFFKHLKSIVGHFFDNEKGIPVTEEAFTVFIEQTISVLRMMFDRLSQPLAQSATGVLDGLLLSFTIYIQRLGFTAPAYRLKIRLCQLCEVVLSKRQGPHQDSVFRNAVLEHFVSWASNAQPAHADESQDRLRKDLDGACLKAMVPLLDGLVVHSPEVNPSTQEIRTDPRLFARYNDFFAFTLHRLSQTGAISSTNGRKPATVKGGVHIAKDNLAFRQCAIDALANLISANVDPAYHQFAEMGAATDVVSRTAYMETLVKVVEKGTRFERSSSVPEHDTYAELISLIRQPDLTLATALCEVCTATNFEDLSDLFLKIFNKPKAIAKFLKAVIEMEVAATDLRNTLKDLLLTLCKKPHAFSMEFDPHRPTPEDDVASRNLEQVTEAFLICIGQSIDQVPSAIREICHHIVDVVGDRFPESVFTAQVIGGFIFLRFINPAIVSPETIDLDLPSDNRDIRRGLVMITKVLQALANNVRFGAKEPGMKKLNAFMDNNIFGMTRFLQAISDFNTAEEPAELIREEALEEGAGLDEADRSFLHQYLCDSMDKLGMELLQSKQPAFRRWREGHEDTSASVGARTWERLTNLIAALGPPPDSATRAASLMWDQPEQAYASFMTRNEARLLSGSGVWKRVFYESSGSKNGSTTFVMLLHRVKADTADLESLVYHVLQQLSRVRGPYEVLFDCSHLAASNEIPTHWVVQFITILPASIVQNLQRIILFSPNSILRQYIRKLARLPVLSFDRLDSRKVIAVSSTAELEQYFTNVESLLPSTTVTVGKERRTIFNHITERHQIRVEHPVVFKVGQRTLLISTVKKQDLFSDVKSGLDDVIELTDIEEIRKVSMGPEGDGISIRIAGEDPVRRFLANVRRDELFIALNSARNEVPAKAVAIRDPHLQPEDVSAVLINIILLNLCSSSDTLRGLGYELLCSLARSYSLDGFEDFAKCTGVYVPTGNLSFLSNVSERLASAVPTHTLGVIVQFAAALENSTAAEAATYINILRPWLHNLPALAHTPREERERVHRKLRRVFRRLINISVQEPALHVMLVSRIWPTLGKIDFLLTILLDEGIRATTAFDSGSDSDPCPVFSQILVALSAGSILRGKVIARLRMALARTSIKPALSLTKSPEWPEIVTLLRLDLALSFDSKIQAQLYLGDLLHVFVSLAATGPPLVRQTLYGLVVNTVHSLAKEPTVDSVKMAELVATLTGSKADFIFDLSQSPGERESWDVSTAGEELVRLLSEILTVAAPNMDMANVWRARWTSLATSFCFHFNPVLQPRSFLTLALAGQSDIDTDLMFQMITALRQNVRLSGANNSLAVNIIRSIACALPGLDIKSHLWVSVFWMSVSLIQIGNSRITAATIPLLTVALEGLNRGGLFKEHGMVEVLLRYRDDEDDQSAPMLLDEGSGVDFRQNFSFALARVLAKALRHAPLTDASIDLLFKLILCAREGESPPHSPTTNGDDVFLHQMVSPSALGYFLVLLPTVVRVKRLDDLLVVSGIDVNETGSAMFDEIAQQLKIKDNETAFLTFALLSGLAQASESGAELVAIFTLFSSLATQFPDVAGYLYESLVPVLSSVITTSDNLELLDAAQLLLRSDAGRQPVPRAESASFLSKIGFPGLDSASIGAYSSDELAGTTPLQQEMSDYVARHINDILLKPSL